jgi:hypothetical protein
VSVGGLVWGLFGGLGKNRSEDGKEKASESEAGKGDDEPADWVRVLTVYSPVEAQMGAARLSDQGIPARIQQESAGAVFPVTVGMLGAIHLYVPEAKEEQAIIVLKDTLDLPDEEDDEA